MANKVQVLDPPRAISREPRQDAAGSELVQFSGWFWRHDLAAISDCETEVTLRLVGGAAVASRADSLSAPSTSTTR